MSVSLEQLQAELATLRERLSEVQRVARENVQGLTAAQLSLAILSSIQADAANARDLAAGLPLLAQRLEAHIEAQRVHEQQAKDERAANASAATAAFKAAQDNGERLIKVFAYATAILLVLQVAGMILAGLSNWGKL